MLIKKSLSLILNYAAALLLFCGFGFAGTNQASAQVFSSLEVRYDEVTTHAAIKERFNYCKAQVMNISTLTIHDAIEQKARHDRPCLQFEDDSEIKVKKLDSIAYVMNLVGFLQMVYKVFVETSCDGHSAIEQYDLLVSSYLPTVSLSEIRCDYSNIK